MTNQVNAPDGGETGGLAKRIAVPKLDATKPMPEVRYSHPLTEEQQAQIDKFIASIKEKRT